MPESPPLDALVQDTLENLIRQFSHELCFYRELIQNALDANSNRVDVWLEFVARDKGRKGTAIIHVDDFGEGMNRAIIDTQLTRLFSSTKEKDFTKIGKFGVGFVSVFAVSPAAVIVDTSRDGENWRVVFRQDRTFDRIRIPFPVDGTKVRILKPMTAQEYSIFVEESLRTVKFWCRHSEVPITFQGTPVNEPFDLDLPFKLRHALEGTEVVLGLTGGSEPFFGFYNGGITLLEGKRRFFPGVAFKIKSRYLEHTITRDNILQNENYGKAMDILEEIVRTVLPERLFDEIAKLAASDHQRHDRIVALGLPWLAGEVTPRNAGLPVIPLVDGTAVSLAALRKALPALRSRSKSLGLPYLGIPCDTAPWPLTAQFPLVVKTEPGTGLASLLKSLAGHLPFVVSRALASPALVEPPGGFAPLAASLVRFLDQQGVTVTTVHAGNFEYPGSSVAHLPFLLADRPGEPSPVERTTEQGTLRGGPETIRRSLLRSKPGHLVLNVRHPYVQSLLDLAAKDSLLAAYLFCRVFFLDDGLKPGIENRLMRSFMDSLEAKAPVRGATP